MSPALSTALTIGDNTAHDWARDAAEAAARVPVAGTQAVDWTVRGWAEVALGCAVIGSPDAFGGLDDVVRASRVPCRGPFGDRLRALRALGGNVPACYFGNAAGSPTRHVMAAHTGDACMLLAEFCDALSAAIATLRHSPEQAPEPRANATDHLRWGERLRPGPVGPAYEVRRITIAPNLAWRSWLCLPGGSSRRITLVDLAGAGPTSVRQRICHGIHNGAHLDHLGALADADRAGTWTHAPIEFGSGLLAAESFAMAVELLAAAECVLAGLAAEAHQLLLGFIERIGRIPGYRDWHARYGHGCRSITLAAAAIVTVREFATLPAVAANYVTGPLRLLSGAAPNPLLPAMLNDRFRQRWTAAATRFPAAALLADRAGDLA
jgi:hypothetical protein